MPIRLRRASIGILLGLAVVTLTLASAVAADCEFVLGFKTLRDLIGHAIVGECLEDEHFSENGDSTQATTGGLLVWRNADNHTAFTDGNHTWINGPHGLQQRLNSERFPWEPDYAPGGGILAPTATPTATPTPQPATARATGSTAPSPTTGIAFSSPWPGPCASFTWEFQYSTTEEASAVTGYQISRRKPEVSGEDTFSVLATVSDSSYQECGLEDGVLYEYEIRPKNEEGISEFALTLTANGSSQTPTPTPTPAPAGPPPPPPPTPTPTPAGPLTPPPTPTPTPVGPPPPPPPTPVPTPIPTPIPTPVPTPIPTPIPTPVPTPIPTPVPTPVPTPIPTPVPTPIPTPVPTPTPATPPEDEDCETNEDGNTICFRPLTPEEWDALSDS